MDYKTTSIIKDFYDTVAFLLQYERTDRTANIEKQILRLLCEQQDGQDVYDACQQSIEDAGFLQVCTDEALIRASALSGDAAPEIKLGVLRTNNIERLRTYNEWIFANTLREYANLGLPEACKLIACLSYLGTVLPENREAAVNVWSTLATNGDWSAMRSLVHAYGEMGNQAEALRWQHILTILQSEYEAFSPVAQRAKYGDYTEDEVQFANLIMFIRRKNVGRRTQILDHPMLHYVLESKEQYENKMCRLSSETNYYMVMEMEERATVKKCGF